jgi:hypothetical protein
LYLYNVTNYILIMKQWSKKCVFIFCNIITSMLICLVKACDSWNVRAHRCCGIAYVPPSCHLCSNAPPNSLGNCVAIGRCRRYTVSHTFCVLGAHKNETIDVSRSKIIISHQAIPFKKWPLQGDADTTAWYSVKSNFMQDIMSSDIWERTPQFFH